MALRPTAFDLPTAQKIARHVRDFDLIAQRRPRRQYFYGGGGGGNPFGYAVVRSVNPDSQWTVEAQFVTPVNREAGEWMLQPEVVTMYTDNIQSIYYQPFIWSGGSTMHEGHILPVRREGNAIIITQQVKYALVAQPLIRPPTNCQLY